MCFFLFIVSMHYAYCMFVLYILRAVYIATNFVNSKKIFLSHLYTIYIVYIYVIYSCEITNISYYVQYVIP